MYITENNVSVKYKTKKINTYCKEFFLATIKKSNASTRSRRNFNPIATRVCIVCASGSFAWPLLKILIVTKAMAEKDNESARMSLNFTESSASETRMHPAAMIRILISRRKSKNPDKGLEKSFTL
jgi:hypothetical protein